MIHNIAIVGMGALGLLYADQLTHGLSDMNAVEFIMDSDRAARHRKDVYTINDEKKEFRIVDSSKAQPADLVIVAVKYTSLPEALQTMEHVVGEGTIILSVMNGVTSERIIAARYGWKHMIMAVAQGMDAMREGSSLKYTQCGHLHIGTLSADAAAGLCQEDPAAGLCPQDPAGLAEAMQNNLLQVEELFERAKVPYIKEQDIAFRMWFKFMLNVGVNQSCMVFDTTYGVVTTDGTLPNQKMVGAMREVIPCAKANGVTLTEEDIRKCIQIEQTLDPEGYPSMAQDRKAGRRSEVDMFAGEVLRMSETLGLEAPCNRFFMDRVREIEASYSN